VDAKKPLIGQRVEVQIAVVGVDRERLRIRKRLWNMRGGGPHKVVGEEVREFTAEEAAAALWVDGAVTT
jgi:hypothetical protein